MACSLWQVCLGVYFIFLRPPLLPEDVRFLGTTLAALRSSMPGLEKWLGHVFTVMGGFMIGSGLLTGLTVNLGLPGGKKWPWLVLALTGAFTVGMMSLINFQIGSDFKWILLVPVLLWILGLAASVTVGRKR